MSPVEIDNALMIEEDDVSDDEGDDHEEVVLLHIFFLLSSFHMLYSFFFFSLFCSLIRHYDLTIFEHDFGKFFFNLQIKTY